MYNRSAVRYAGVTDGLSNTAVASEKLRGMGTYDVVRDLFWVPEVTSIDAMYQSCTRSTPATEWEVLSRAKWEEPGRWAT